MFLQQYPVVPTLLPCLTTSTAVTSPHKPIRLQNPHKPIHLKKFSLISQRKQSDIITTIIPLMSRRKKRASMER